MGQAEWRLISAKIRFIAKWGDLKLFECPLSFITKKTWEILQIVNETTNAAGEILLLPWPGTLLEQPSWYRESVRIVRAEKNKYQQQRLKEVDKG